MGKSEVGLEWQSKAILLIVVPWSSIAVVFQALFWMRQAPVVVWETLGISVVFGLLVWRMRAATPAGAATGAVITAALMFGTVQFPYERSWLHGGLMPLLALFLLTYIATKIGKSKKERLGTGESKRGRSAAQVAANLGAAALIATAPIKALITGDFSMPFHYAYGLFAAVTMLSEAAADTVSSEIGQVFGGDPRIITTLRRVPRGTDGGISLEGTLAGTAASLIVATIGIMIARGGHFYELRSSICIATVGGSLGLLFDSLLGALLERRGLLNNDAVNFLSTISALVFAAGITFVYLFILWFDRITF